MSDGMTRASSAADTRRRVPRTRRVPVVLQQEPTECAAACLAMVLGAHGRATTLDECRGACGAGRDGADAAAIVRAARARGLAARGYSAGVADLATLDLPVIVHWRANHFVVVERIDARGFTLVDPARGRSTLSVEEFAAGFSSVVLTFEPTETFERRDARELSPWRTYLREIAGTPGLRRSLASVLGSSLALQALGLVLPLFTKLVVDELIPRAELEGPRWFLILGGGALVWVGAQASFGWMRALVLLRLRARLDAHVMARFFAHLLSLPFAYFQTRTTGDLLMRLSSNAVLRELVTAQSVSVVLDGLLVIAYLALLAWWSAPIAAVVVAFGVLQASILWIAAARTRELAQADLRAQSSSQSSSVEVLSGISTVKAAAAEARALEHWNERLREQLDASVARARFTSGIETALGALHTLAPLALLLLGARAVLEGELSLGSMFAVLALAAAFLAPLSSLLGTLRNLQVVGAHLERITDVLQARPEQDAAGKRPLEHARVAIELEQVSFRYSSAAPEVLRDVTLRVEPGTKLAIVGPTGSGKSTLGLLLLGLHAPSSGGIRYGGEPLEALDLRSLRARFGVVLQDAALFAGSLRENIAFHDPALPHASIVAAARMACIDEELAALPLGYDTRLGEGGAGLSGGQQQRLALARALAHGPDVLLLDEATSHVDAATEARIEERLASLGCTRIVIAHRLSTVRDADLIVVLDQGRIVERGTHDELLARDGLYRRLVAGSANAPVART